MPQEPTQIARSIIDQRLQEAGWVIQDRSDMTLYANNGVVVREFPMIKPDGNSDSVDYMLSVDRQEVGVFKVKHQSITLSGIADQSSRFAASLPQIIPHAGEEIVQAIH